MCILYTLASIAVSSVMTILYYKVHCTKWLINSQEFELSSEYFILRKLKKQVIGKALIYWLYMYTISAEVYAGQVVFKMSLCVFVGQFSTVPIRMKSPREGLTPTRYLRSPPGTL